VFVGVASIPSREASLKKVVQRLLPQARQIGVYLNGYDKVPQFLRRSRIVVARSQDHGDLRDNGKFFFLDKTESRYYASVDDDVFYPWNYLRHLVELLHDAEQLAAVGVHGAIYPSPIDQLFGFRVSYHFQNLSPHVMPVHLLGTGTALFDQREWKLAFDEFSDPGMADVWFAAAAARRNASLFTARRDRNWVSSISWEQADNGGGELYSEGLLDSARQVSVLNGIDQAWQDFDRLVRTLLASAKFTEEISLHQALELDVARKQLGYGPMSEETTVVVRNTLEKRAQTWVESHQLDAEVAHSIGDLTIDILADRVSAIGVAAVLEILDQFEMDHARLEALPTSLRYDTSPDRVEGLKSALVEHGMRHGELGAQQTWSLTEGRARISVEAALVAERASVETGFERLPAFQDLARVDPLIAASRLYDYFDATDWKRAPDFLGLRGAFGAGFESLDLQILACLAAARSGNDELARPILNRLIQDSPWDRDVRILEAALSASEQATPIERLLPALRVLDEALEPQGLSAYQGLVQDRSDKGHWIHNLSRLGQARQPEVSAEPDVSVLMTVYNDSETVGPAIMSVLESSGVDLQLIVIDDASTDDSLDRIRAFDDPRIVVVRNKVNVGPYLSRNRGLEVATGRFVAIADADDWSHPQRLQYQMSILEKRAHLVACQVAHIRVRRNGTVDLENHLRFVGQGPVSLMFRRWLIDHIGGFDHVRTRGDVEYLGRIGARFGEEALPTFDIPLILATSSVTSNSKRFRADSLKLYRAAARRWHRERALTDALYVPLTGDRAPFMAPHDLLVVTPAGGEPGHLQSERSSLK
jgi:hypothetical protein